MQHSIIQKSQLEGAHRLDAEYYQPEYLEVAKILKKYQPLKDFVSDIIHPQEVKREYSEDGYLFVLSQNLRENYLDFSNKFYISDDIAKQISKNLLDEGDIVTVRTGNIGLSAVISGFEKKVYASADIIVIKNPKVSSFYVSTFLNSKFGRLYLNRIIYGALQPHITPKLLGEIPIPLQDEVSIKNIHKIVEIALEGFRQSEFLYSQAENLLLEELDLKNFEVEDDLSYIVNLSEVKSAHRVDAEYFQPKYEKLIKRIKEKVKIQELKIIATTRRGSLIDPKFYDVVEGTPYIRGKDFSSGRLEKSGLVYISKNFRPKNEIKVNSGDLVFALIGSVGTSALVSEEFNNSFISNNTGKIVIKNKKETLPEYLAIVLDSIVGKLQFEKEISQTAQPKISDSQVNNFYIPILSKTTQQKIAELVKKSHEARSKAKQFLEQAKQKVEELIDS